MNTGAPLSIIKNRCLEANKKRKVEKSKVQTNPSFQILTGNHRMHGIVTLQHGGHKFDIYAAPNND